jgi:Rieske Fe-S protein
MQKVEHVKRPLKVGERYLVPCVVDEYDGQTFVYPVINHPHTDTENGQPETHYHLDYRFVKHDNQGKFPRVTHSHSRYNFETQIRPEGKIEYFVLEVINEDFHGITPVELIAKSKLKHKCIHKGKCPHRGYELSQAAPKDGVITCPLHGLRFDAETKQLLQDNK